MSDPQPPILEINKLLSLFLHVHTHIYSYFALQNVDQERVAFACQALSVEHQTTELTNLDQQEPGASINQLLTSVNIRQQMLL